MRRPGEQPPIQIVPADQSVFRGADPVPSGPTPPRARLPASVALVVGALVVAVVFMVSRSGERGSAPVPTTSTAATSTTLAVSEVPSRPPRIGAPAPDVSSTDYRLVFTPSTVHSNDFVTVTIDGPTNGLAAQSPLLLTVDDRIGGFWRTLAWFVGAPLGGGPFLSGVVISDAVAIPPPDVKVPIAAVIDPFQVQIGGLVPGDYRLCRRLLRLGGQADDYVCTTITVIQ